MVFESRNPFTGELIQSHQVESIHKVNECMVKMNQAYQDWARQPMIERSKPMFILAGLLRSKKKELAKLISSEMGKILRESEAEIEKCAWLCDYYASESSEMLLPEVYDTDASTSQVQFEPMGIIYGIMPWNFPFWQVLRAAVPTLMAGNAFVLKHAPNVFGCGQAIADLFVEAGFPTDLFHSLIIDLDTSEKLIANPLVKGLTLTGSLEAGRTVAMQAASHLKKTVLELGGSDPYIVLKDANLDIACSTAVTSRMLNAGQVCISAKRFIVEAPIYDEFVEKHKILLQGLKLGDPLDPSTDMGPLARKDLVENIEKQVSKSIDLGAKLECGGMPSETGQFYQPTLLTEVSKGMPVYDEETFGPVSVVIKAKDAEDAIAIANESNFGLGASLWTEDLELAKILASKIEAGAVFVNGMCKSDPRLPFGGIKLSGYGRELGPYGIKEFVNIKTVWVA